MDSKSSCGATKLRERSSHPRSLRGGASPRGENTMSAILNKKQMRAPLKCTRIDVLSYERKIFRALNTFLLIFVCRLKNTTPGIEQELVACSCSFSELNLLLPLGYWQAVSILPKEGACFFKLILVGRRGYLKGTCYCHCSRKLMAKFGGVSASASPHGYS
jgi:hypothetical protein